MGSVTRCLANAGPPSATPGLAECRDHTPIPDLNQLHENNTPEGTIYGCDHDDDYFISMVGFARSRFDTYITLDAGGGELKNPTESVWGSMNNGATRDGSVIVGLYVDPPDSNGQYHGYVVHHGTFHPYDVPGSVAKQTWGINSAADFVGLYDDANGN